MKSHFDHRQHKTLINKPKTTLKSFAFLDSIAVTIFKAAVLLMLQLWYTVYLVFIFSTPFWSGLDL